MTFLLGVMLILIPLCIGSGIQILYRKGQRSLCLVYVSGSMAVFLFSGLIQLIAILGKSPFSVYEKIFLTGIFVLLVAGAVIGFVLQQRGLTEKENYRKVMIPVVVFLLAGIFMIIWSEVDSIGDFTLETVNTTLSTDGIYEFNSFTGMQIEEGMPIRQKILTSAILYAAISDVFGLETQRVVYLYMPLWLLLNVICMAVLWAKSLFEDEKWQKVFLWFYALLMFCGGYGFESAGYQMWSRGYTGNAWVVAVVVPIIVFACMKRNIMLLVLALATEVFLAWTTYGIGFGAVTAVLCLMVWLVQGIVKRARKD